MTAKVNTEECIGCGICVDECAVEALTVDETAVVDADKCIDCGACVDACPTDAIEI